MSDEDRALYEEVERLDPDRANVVCFGDRGLEGGRFFNEWRESMHVVKPFAMPRDWMKFRAMDFGQARPYAVVWFAVDFDGNIYAYRELYGRGGKPNVGTGETAKQIAEQIAALKTPGEHLRYGVLDSACRARTGGLKARTRSNSGSLATRLKTDDEARDLFFLDVSSLAENNTDDWSRQAQARTSRHGRRRPLP